MTNQAAQTMPELPVALASIHADGYWTTDDRRPDWKWPARQRVFSVDQMHQYARDYAAMLAAAPAASGGECTNPAPGHDAGEDLSDYVRIAHLIGSIFFYGNFKAETFNERELESLLRKVSRFYESEEQVISGEPTVERPLHFATENLIRRFSDALREKLSAAEKKYGYSDGWASPDWMDECRKHLMQHIAKGDPRDVAAYCAFLWHHGESTTPQPPSAASVSERARASKQVHDMLIDLRAAASIGRPITGDELHELEQDILRAIEQALTQQRGSVEPIAWAATDYQADGPITQYTSDRYAAEYYESIGLDVCPLYATTPQPSADAVRELVKRWRVSARVCGETEYSDGARDAFSQCSDELESLLSGGSHA